MRLVRPIAAYGLAVAAMLAVPQGPVSAAEPTFQSEAAAHPRLARAIQQMERILHELSQAPTDFGGNKAAAMQDLRQSIHSLRKALFYRIRADDAAIDHAPLR